MKYDNQNIGVEKEIVFDNRKNLISLCEYHKNGGILSDGMSLVYEANYRSKLQDVILNSWHIGSVKMDLTGLGKYSESNTKCYLNGKLTNIPFTMLYIRNDVTV